MNSQGRHEPSVRCVRCRFELSLVNMAQPLPPRLSETEYLALERELPHKHEFIDGHIVAMAGATWEHNRVVANVVGLLGSALQGRPCVVQPSDLKVKVV